MLESMNLAILIGSILVVAAAFTSLISFRFGAPLLLVFLLVGLLAGEDGIAGVDFDNANAAYFIGSIALAVILFDSGFETRVTTLRSAALPAAVLSTAGVVITALLVGLAAQVLFGFSWLEGLLLGAIVAPTDAAAVFFLLRVGGITLRERVRSTLEIESGSNDPIAVFLTLSLVELVGVSATPADVSIDLATQFLIQAVLGSMVGVVAGLIIAEVTNRTNLETALHPIVVLAFALTVFATTNMMGGSGFLAVYIAGIVAGNVRMRHAVALRRFQSGTTWLSQIAMFLTLGLLATPSQFPSVLLGAIALAAFLTLIARPAAVWIGLLPFGFTRHEIAFVSWVGLRGAVSILLAILPIMAGLAHAREMFNIAFIVVLASLLVQGWTIKPMARFLGLVVPSRQGPVDRIELELPGKGEHEIVAYVIHPDSAVARGERIPRWARPSLLVRDGRSLRPHNAGRPRPGDQVYIITTPRFLPLLDRMFGGHATTAIDDPRLYGEFSLEPDARLSEVAGVYGIKVTSGDEALTVAELFRRELAGDIEPGDRIAYGPVDLIVRRTSESHEIEEVGLAVEPTRQARPNIPVFQSRKEIAAYLRRLRQRRGKPVVLAKDDTALAPEREPAVEAEPLAALESVEDKVSADGAVATIMQTPAPAEAIPEAEEAVEAEIIPPKK
jgi:cell volume regulation protein A